LELIIIAAMATNRVIGCNNAIPWKIPEEMAHFKSTTMGHTLIMGRKTYESLGGPLPGRRNIIVSADPCVQVHPSCTVAASLSQAITLCQGAGKVFFIGGAQLYRAALPLAQTLILTVIGQDFAGDAFFPDFSGQGFVLAETKQIAASLPLTLLTYRRPAPPSSACEIPLS
jgi:dihydrofolate reductase